MPSKNERLQKRDLVIATLRRLYEHNPDEPLIWYAEVLFDAGICTANGGPYGPGQIYAYLKVVRQGE